MVHTRAEIQLTFLSFLLPLPFYELTKIRLRKVIYWNHCPLKLVLRIEVSEDGFSFAVYLLSRHSLWIFFDLLHFTEPVRIYSELEHVSLLVMNLNDNRAYLLTFLVLSASNLHWTIIHSESVLRAFYFVWIYNSKTALMPLFSAKTIS